MSLGKWIAEEILTEESKIKNIVAIYPGRFQPMHKHTSGYSQNSKMHMLQQVVKLTFLNHHLVLVKRKR